MQGPSKVSKTKKSSTVASALSGGKSAPAKSSKQAASVLSDDSSSSEEEDDELELKKPKRFKFGTTVKSNALDGFNLRTGESIDTKQRLDEWNGSVPHRMPWSSLRDNTMLFAKGEEDEEDFERWTNRLVTASDERVEDFEEQLNTEKDTKRKATLKRTIKRYSTGKKTLLKKRKVLIEAVDNDDMGEKQEAMNSFLNTLNSFPANVPDIGPHNGVNLQVSDRPHYNIDEEGWMSPSSYQVAQMSPHRLREVPFSPGGEHIVTTGGTFVDPELVMDQYGSNITWFDKRKSINAKLFTFDNTLGFREKEDSSSSSEEEDIVEDV